MKRTLQTLLSMVVVAASLASCAKETLKENSIPAGEKIQVAVSGSIGEFVPANDGTKANAESVVRVTWAQTNDKVYVYDGSAYLGSLDVTPNVDNPSHALLSGTINTSEATPTNLSLVYVKGAETAPVINGGKISVDISTQSATGVADVPFVLYATIEYDEEKLTKENEFVPFSFATSVMTVNCTNLPVDANKAKINITKAKIDGVSTACELTVDGTGVTAVSGTTPGTITRTAGFEQADSRGSFKLALAADPATPAARNILVFQDTKVRGAAFTSTTLAKGNSYNTVYQMGEYVPMPPADALSGLFTVADDGQGSIKKVHFSKGNLTYNVSTTTWAFYEHQCDCATGYDSNLISLFTWGYDATNSIVPGGEGYVGGHTDENDKQLSKSEDWGYVFGRESSIWRTLTAAEWDYLFATTEFGTNQDTESPRYNLFKTGVKVCGVENCLIIAPDNWNLTEKPLQNEYSPMTWEQAEAAGLVCLPAVGGYRNGEEFYAISSFNQYWSSTADGSEYAGALNFDSSFVSSVSPNERGNGFSVRLVTDAR